MAASLCAKCRRINFSVLRGPSPSELDDLCRPRNAEYIYGAKTEDMNERILYGTLRDMRQDAGQCRLCSLLCHIIDRQGAVGMGNRNLDANDVVFVATAGAVSSYFGVIGTIDPPETTGYVLQKLTLTAHEAVGAGLHGESLAWLTHVLHARTPGVDDLPVRNRTYEPSEVQGTTLFGARLRPLQVDIAVLRNWIEICTEEHGAFCANTLGKDIESYTVRFIDVNRMSVTIFTDRPLSTIRYLALSYVWGPPEYQKTRLVGANRSDLAADGSLKTVGIPKTIKDAIKLAQVLKFQYLWVDALCVVQDDLGDQKIQISNMHGIYKSAFLTIVAASGEHADAGLPGLAPNTRSYKQDEVVVIDPTADSPGLSLVTTVKKNPQSWDRSFTTGQGDLETSIWNRRAWTMQEKALSRRTITFSEEQVSWDCPCTSFCEDSFFEIRNFRCRSFIKTSFHELSLSSLAQTTPPWELYRNLVSVYSQRILSFEGDYSDAFAAIIEMLNDTKGEQFIWGLPCSRFGLALSWDTIYGAYRRKALSKLPMTSLNRRIKFPSWSWLGWVGHAHCSVADDRLESESSTVVCYVHRSNPLRFLPVHEIGRDADSMGELDSSGSDFSVTNADVEYHLPRLTSDVLSDLADDYVLFFWANTARLLVQPPASASFENTLSTGEESSRSRPVIYNALGEQVGTACPMKAQHWSSTDGELHRTSHDFIAVGRRHVSEIPEYPAQVLVLQVEWKGAIAYRTNIAEIDEAAWLGAMPKKSLVALA